MEKKEPSWTVGGNANWYSHCGKSMAFPQKAKNRTALQSSDCTTGYLSKKYKNTNSKGYMHPYVYYSIICNSQPKCPLADEWIKRKWYIYTMGYYSTIEKNEILPFTMKWMEVESIMLSEVRERHKPYDFTLVEFKKQ